MTDGRTDGQQEAAHMTDGRTQQDGPVLRMRETSIELEVRPSWHVVVVFTTLSR